MRSIGMRCVFLGIGLVLLLHAATSSGQAVSFSAGPQLHVEGKTQNVPAFTISTVFAALPEASMSWAMRRQETRNPSLLEVEFAGECRLIGGDGDVNWVELRAEVRTDIPVAGFPKILEPGLDDVASPLGFCSADLFESHAAGWMTALPAVHADVTYTVEIQWRTNDSANTGWLDDWVLKAIVSGQP